MRFVFSTILLFFFLNKAFAQEPSLSDSIRIQAQNREKIYVHFDKNRYFPGDTVWYKAYLFADHLPSRISKNFYLELFNPDGTIINRSVSPIIASTASGFVVISQELKAESLLCRAYTVAMLNADTSFIYRKTIPIFQQEQVSHPQHNTAILARFLPEGGNWIAGLPCVLAFKITDNNGFPLAVKGTITDSKDKSFKTEFSTSHDGMGTCTVLPQDSHSYFAVWHTDDGRSGTTSLPAVLKEGVTIQISNLNKARKIGIFRSNQIANENKKLNLIAVINSTVVYQSVINLELQTNARVIIPTSELPTGILYVTVLNEKMQPLAERITFVNNANYSFPVTASIDHMQKEKRVLNQLKLVKPDSVSANLSLSITDADIDPLVSNQDNMLTHLLLTGDLHGKIYNPSYYFNNNQDSTQRNLDLVMLTNGWRKYHWTPTNTPIRKLTESDYLTITGKLKDFEKGDKNNATTVSAIITPDNGESTLVDFGMIRNGNFSKSGMIFYGDASLVLKFNKNKSELTKESQIELSNGLLPSYPFKETAAASADIPASKAENNGEDFSIQNQHFNPAVNHVLSEVIIKGKASTTLEALDKKYTQGIFKGGISRNIDLGNDPKALNYLTFFQYLQMNITGLQVSGATSLVPVVTWRKAPVKFFLNNVESSPADIRTLPMAELDYVKIYDPAQGNIFQSEGGTVAVYSKSGNGMRTGPVISPKSRVTGYSQTKEFYVPESGSIISTMSQLLDNRSTLLWSPNIFFDEKTHTLNVPFYYNSFSKKIKVVLEGLNASGKIIHLEQVY